MILPVAREALPDWPDTLALGALTLRRKIEHHVTVFNTRLGALVRAAAAARPGLPGEIEALAATHDWTVGIEARHVHLVEDGLHTVVVMVRLDLRGFFALVREHAATIGADAALVAALDRPGPPHVTIYTSDPSGAAGIGLDTELALAEALAAGASDEPAGLRAYRLAPGVVVARS
jgi:hypothetical protein